MRIIEDVVIKNKNIFLKIEGQKNRKICLN